MIEIIHALRSTNKRTSKENILKDNKNNEQWKKYLHAVYDNSINYYIKSVPDNTFYSSIEYASMDFDLFFDQLAYLSSRKVTGNAAKEYAIDMSMQYGELFRLVLDRSINAGITKTTINKIYKDLIPEFKVMLGKDQPIQSWPVYGSLKFDGIRLVVFVKNGYARCKTRSGKDFPLKSLELAMGMCEDGVYDGELIARSGKMVDRTRISGEANKIIKGTSTSIKDYKFMVFDYLTTNEWETETCDRSMRDRMDLLQNCLQQSALIKMVEQKIINNEEEANDWFLELTDQGFEGIILRPIDSLYEWKRSSFLIKKKLIKETKLVCTNVIEGEGKYSGMVGALECEGYAEGVEVYVNIGSGFSDEDRDKDPSFYKGRTIEVLYNSIIRPKDSDRRSLFLPRFKRVLGDTDI